MERAPKELQEPLYQQLKRDEDFQVKSKGEKQIETKFGSLWSSKDDKRGTAEIEFEGDKTAVKIDFDFLGQWMLASLLIYIPLLLVVGLSLFGGIYPITIVFLIILVLFIRYHHSTFQKTADNYHSKLKSIMFVIQSEEFEFCPNCGQDVDISRGEGPTTCPRCGYEFRGEKEKRPPPSQPDASQQFFDRKRSRERPTGVSILAILHVLGGLFSLLVLTALPSVSYLAQILGTIGTAIVLAEAIGSFVVAYGLWNGMKWAWIGAIIFAIIGLLSLGLGTIVSILILFYLFKKEVKAYFR